MRNRPTVILLHTGPGADHSLYKEHIGPALWKHRAGRLSRPPRGGRSDWSSPEHWTIDTWVDDLEAFCETLESSGHMLLGTASAGVWSRSSTLHAIPIESSGSSSSAPSRATCAALDRRVRPDRRAGGPRKSQRAISPLHRGAPRRVPARVHAALHAQADLPGHGCADGDEHRADHSLGPHGRRNFDVREEAAGIRCPTLVLAGDDGPSTTISGVDNWLVEALPAGLVRYEHFADTGHGVFRDRPEAIDSSPNVPNRAARAA